MKKRKLVQVTASMYEQNKYLVSRVVELRRERDALRRELADLSAACEACVERNVALSAEAEEWKKERAEQIAEFTALEQVHKYISKKADKCYARAEAAEALIEQLNQNLEVQGRNASDEYATAQRLRDDVSALQDIIKDLAAQRDAALARARKSDEMFSRIQALCGSEDV